MTPMQGEKFQRQNRYQRRIRHKERDRKVVVSYRKGARGNRNVHHLTNVCNGGADVESNLFLMKVDRHYLLHKYFKNMSWEEITDALKSIFGVGDPHKVIAVMERVSRMKGRAA